MASATTGRSSARLVADQPVLGLESESLPLNTDGIVAMVALSVPTYAEEQTVDIEEVASELTLNIDSRTFRQVRDLQVVQDANRIVLRGRSGSYYVKQLATHAVMELMPGMKVENCIAVTR